MQIHNREIYINKTKRYLLPVIKDYGNELVEKISSVHKLAIGISDALVEEGMRFNNHIYILVDTDIERDNFISVLNWLKEQEYFEFDYPYDDIVVGHLHMIVLRLPETHKDTYKNFINAKFSKMYRNQDLKNYFSENDIRYHIITKSDTAIKHFVDIINKEFDTHYIYSKWKNEVEFPPRDQDEVFNYELINTDGN